MVTTTKARLPKDPTRINVHDELELQWWSTRLSVTPDVLRSAVDEHGPSAEEVRRKLHEAGKIALSKGGED